MVEKKKDMEIPKQDMVSEETERTRECQCFIPKADIYEIADDIIVVMDMPGINENAIDIALEKNVLNVKGLAQMDDREGYSLVFAEYETGDFERSFRISDSINQERIEAIYKNGVLKLTLPKAEEAKTRKIEVKIG